MRQLTLILSSLFLLGCAGTPGSVGRDAPKAPELKVADQDGRIWTLADAQAKPLLVDFWATWCAPCLQALPDLNRFAQDHAAHFTVLGVAMDQQGWPVVAPVVRRYGLSYPIAVAPPDFGEAYGARALPYLVVLHQGKIVKSLTGRHTYRDLQRELAPWLP